MILRRSWRGTGLGARVGTRDINVIEIFVPAAGEAAGPPIVLAIIMRFTMSRDDRPWNAAGPHIDRRSRILTQYPYAAATLSGMSRCESRLR